MSVRFKYYLRGCGLGILVASLVFIVSLHAHGGAMSDEKAMQRASELGMIMPDDTQTQEAETQTTEGNESSGYTKNDTGSDTEGSAERYTKTDGA